GSSSAPALLPASATEAATTTGTAAAGSQRVQVRVISALLARVVARCLLSTVRRGSVKCQGRTHLAGPLRRSRQERHSLARRATIASTSTRKPFRSAWIDVRAG